MRSSGIGVLSVVLSWHIVAVSLRATSCPPLQSDTVRIECKLAGDPVDCTSRRSAQGTVATFRCKLLHHFLFDYLPPGGYESRCEPSGEWSVQPFRCVPVCGQPTGNPTPFIRGGRNVTSGADYPWHVTIYDVYLDMQQMCGGTLISPKFFVSAAHCFHDDVRPRVPSRYRVAVGKIKRSANVTEKNAQFMELYAIHLADNYGARKFQYQNDIALVEVANEVDMTSWALPVCVDWARDLPPLRDGEEGTVVGFGDLGGLVGKALPSEDLKVARLPFVHAETCRRKINNKLAIYNVLPDKFCVGFRNRTNVGQGDSGGGLAFPNEAGQWFLRGVVSVGDAQSSTSYSFFTDVASFIPWMSGIIRQGQVSGRRCGVDVDEAAVVDGEEAHREDFPWEVDIYLQDGLNFTRLWTGVLVEPTMVVAPTDRRKDITNIPPERFRVVAPRNSISLESAVHVYEVIRTFTPSQVEQDFGLSYELIVFELRRPLSLMPVCFDWTGNALLQRKRNGTAIGTTLFRASITLDKPAWQRYAIIPGTDCSPMATWPIPLHRVCAREWNDELQASRGETPSMVVNVDGAWYLRGIRVGMWDIGERWFFPLYTDMINPGVRQWMATTRDMLGKPTCGEVNLCEPLTADAPLPGHLPWNVAVVATNTFSTRWASGVLVQPNAVLTNFENVRGGDDLPLTYGERSKYPLPMKNITVAWTDANGSPQTSKVVRVHLNTHSIGRLLEVAILELDPSTPIFNTPVCLDLSGNVVLSPRSGQVSLVELWKGWNPSNHSLLGVTLIERPDCKALSNRVYSLQGAFVQSRMFCIRSRKDAFDWSSKGAGFLSREGSRWYLQGVLSTEYNLRSSSVAFVEDLSNEEMRLWLRKQLNKIPKVELILSNVTSPKSCVGKRTSQAQCGALIPRNEFGEYGFNDFETFPFTHMDWQVRIRTNDPVYKWGPSGSSDFAGVLIHSNLVLTSASGVVVEKQGNDTNKCSFIAATNISVEYAPKQDVFGWKDELDSSRQYLSSEVARIHLRERTQRRRGAPCFDLALLELKSPVPLMPVCLPSPGAVGKSLAPLATETRGVTERYMAREHGDDERLIPTVLRSHRECEQLLSGRDAKDDFCAEPQYEGKHYSNTIGAAYAVLTEGKWYLRGVLHRDLSDDEKDRTMYSFHNLDDDEVLVWLDQRMRAVSGQQDANILTSEVLPGFPPIDLPRKPPTRSKCGFHLAVGEHGEYVKDEYLLEQNTIGHLDWHMSVHINLSHSVNVSVGVLIHPKLVLISGATIAKEMAEGKDGVFPAKNVTVNSNVTVARIYVRQSVPRAELQNDIALLELETPQQEMPVCVPSPGTLAPLTSGRRGLIEGTNPSEWLVSLEGTRTELVPIVYHDKVKQTKPQVGAASGDMFTAGPDNVNSNAEKEHGEAEYDAEGNDTTSEPQVGESTEISVSENDESDSDVEKPLQFGPGTSFVVLTEGKWFLRGVMHSARKDEATRRTSYTFHDMDDSSVLAWLDHEIRAVEKRDTANMNQVLNRAIDVNLNQ